MESTHNSSPRDTNPVLVVLAVAFWLVAGVLAFLYGDKWFMPKAASAESEAVDDLFRFMLGIATFIFLMVETCVFYFGIRYGLLRNRNDDTDGPPIHGNSTVEIVWTLIPAFIVFILTVYSLQVLIDTTEAKDNEEVIGVTAQQFFWQFNYQVEDADGEELVLSSNHVLVVPKDQVIRLEMASQDVIHAFWVPEFRIKQDVMPGRVTEARFTPNVETGFDPNYLTEETLMGDIDTLRTETEELQTALDEINAAIEAETPTDELCVPFSGESEEEAVPVESETEATAEDTTQSSTSDNKNIVPPDEALYEQGFPIVCAELCGANHSVMRGRVFVVEPEVYEAFIERLRLQETRNQINNELAIACGGAAIAEAGRQLFQEYGCNTCHQLADAGSLNMGQGPSLNGVGERAETRPGYESDVDYIRTSIINPSAFLVDGFPDIMPKNFIDRIPPDELEILANYLATQDE